MTRKSESEFAEALRQSPPKSCRFKVGDHVTFTNDYGVKFPGLVIIGFAHEVSAYGRFIHLNTDAYWFPHTEAELILEDVTLSNVAKHLTRGEAMALLADTDGEETDALRADALRAICYQWIGHHEFDDYDADDLFNLLAQHVEASAMACNGDEIRSSGPSDSDITDIQVTA